MTNPSLEDTLKTLTYHQALVLYWTCERLSNENIAARFGYTKSWVVWQMSFVYHKLGIDRKDQKTGKSLHWTQRREIIRERVCPVLRGLINNDPDNLEIFPLIPPNVIEGSIVDISPKAPIPPPEPVQETFPPPEPPPEPPPLPPNNQTPPPEPPPSFYPIELYNAWLLVLEDDLHDPDPDPLPDPPPPPVIIHSERRGINWGRILALLSAVLLGCVIVGALAYWFGTQQNPPPPLTPFSTNTQETPVTETLAQTATMTATSSPTETLAPTFTFTATSTVTPIATDTMPPFDLRVGQELRDERVALKLIELRYNEGYDKVGQRFAPISFVFEFTNHSGGQIMAQFNKSHFVVEDNTGRTAECWFYHISGAVEKWSSNLNDGETLNITARCGDGFIPEDVNTYTLTVHPFTSLPESTWIGDVFR